MIQTGNGHLRRWATARCLNWWKEITYSYDSGLYIQDITDRRNRHCFDGSVQQAKQWLETFPDMVFGLSPKALRSNCHDETHTVFKYLPVRNILPETDAPALRDERKSPQYSTFFRVAVVYRFLAALRGSRSMDEWYRPLLDNFNRFYHGTD